MVVKHAKSYEYVYESDARSNRSEEFLLLKKFLLIVIGLYLLSSIWIFFFIFIQAEWEKRLHFQVATDWAAVTTWKWWMVFVVIISDIVAAYMFNTVFREKPKNAYLILSAAAFVYSIVGICNVLLRGSIVAFALPFAIASYLIILWFLQRKEDEEHELTQGLRLRDTSTMAKFLEE